MFYAKDDILSTSLIVGGIEITQQQHDDAMAAKLSGRKAEIRDGVMWIESVERRTVYSTTDGQAKEIADNDVTPEGYTETERPDNRYDWDGVEWVVNLDRAWESVRSIRDGLLSACDWAMVPDAPTDKVAWTAYRQALRDLPETQTDPLNIVWPEPPSQ